MPDKLSLQNMSSKALESAISIAQQRHNIISSNISNLETPGYKAKDIDFKSAMAQALGSESKAGLAKTNMGHIGRDSGSEPEVEPFEEEGEWNGFNWVSVDKVMNTMTENNLIYRAATEALLRKIAIMKEVIREGGR
ncbi:MAG: flagellar basal body rod protein FlgB [Desulfobacterales bacterium]|jgi:flagellar basal-body rod protein FlgB|nr:flagellar basal body rod protein FlgB [Desulfobacterales bacterium]